MLQVMIPDGTPAPARQVRLYRHGRHQAVHIPPDLELPGDEAVIRKEGSRLILESPSRSLLDVLASLQPIEDELPPIDELPLRPVGL